MARPIGLLQEACPWSRAGLEHFPETARARTCVLGPGGHRRGGRRVFPVFLSVSTATATWGQEALDGL